MDIIVAASNDRDTGGTRPGQPLAGAMRERRSFMPAPESLPQISRFTAGADVAPSPELGPVVLMVSGWACETQTLQDGRRQIFSFKLPGDSLVLRVSPNVATVALTQIEVTSAGGRSRGRGLSHDDPTLLVDALRAQSSGLFAQIVRLGGLGALARIGNLLLDLHDRLAKIGLVKNGKFRVPLTQDALADALGMSPVHFNRTLQHLRRDGLVSTRAGHFTLPDLDRLRLLAAA